MTARRGQHVPNLSVLAVQLHHAVWRCPLCRMEQNYLQYISCLLDIRAEPVVTSVQQETHFVMQRVADDIRGTVKRS